MRKTPMTREELVKRRDEIVASRGPWRFDNLRLPGSVYTIGEDVDGSAARVRRTVQSVLDLSASRAGSLRVLDLGCGEGGVALELGRQGAEVVGVEGRAAAAEKTEFAREALGLARVTIVHSDVRRLTVEDYGFFDVVVATGILDRLNAPAVFEVVKQIAAVCKRFALIEAELAPRPRASRVVDGLVFRGAQRRQHRAGASRAERLAAEERSLDNEHSFLLTRASMLALLARCGFTTIVETLDPRAAEGTPCFAAWKGRRVALQTIPKANAVALPAWGEGIAVAPKRSIQRLLARGRR